jgi:hypothetical protein
MSENLAYDERQEVRSRERRRSRYDRPRSYVSWLALLIGLTLGVGGGLYYAWNINPVEERDIAPWQLREEDRIAYLAAIMLQYSYDGDLSRTVERLLDLRMDTDDPIQRVADIACDLARSGYVDDNTGLRNLRSMMLFYQNQGKSGCADGLIALDPVTNPNGDRVLVLPTSTPIPDPSKTPTPRGTEQPTPTDQPFAPTNAPARRFNLISGLPTFCSAELAGIIEVRVRNFEGEELPGLPVRVTWNGGESTFYTGLKPERGPGYADFEMEPGFSYTIEMPGLSEPVSTPIVASECNLEGGGQSVTSYRLVFQGG